MKKLNYAVAIMFVSAALAGTTLAADGDRVVEGRKAESITTESLELTDGTDTATFGMKTESGESNSELVIGLDEDRRLMVICDAGDVDADFGLSSRADPALVIVDADHTGAAVFYHSGNTLAILANTLGNDNIFVEAAQHIYNGIGDVASGDRFQYVSGTGAELTDTDTEQAWLYIEPKVNQSSTAGYNALEINVTETALGDGTAAHGNNLILAGTSSDPDMFKVSNTGVLTLARSPLPAITFRDSNGTDSDDNGQIYGDLTDTGSGTEDFDVWFRQQVGGTMTTWLYADADGDVEIGSTSQDTAIKGNLDVAQAVYMNITTPDLSGNTYTIASTDYMVLIDDDDADCSGTVVVALPAASSNTGRILIIKKIGSSYTVQLDGNGAELVDESTTKDLTGQYDSYTIQCDGSGWWIQ